MGERGNGENGIMDADYRHNRKKEVLDDNT
jgi:hypothetical protein